MMSSPLALSAVAVFVVFTSVHGCSAAPDVPGLPTLTGGSVPSAQQPYTRLLSVNTSGYAEPAELVLRSEGTLADAWRTLHNGVAGNPAPAIDLTQKIVVLLALGPRNTGGYAIRFDSMTVEPSGAIVRYTVTSPGPTCMTTQMITSPVDVVSVPRVDGQIRFDGRRTVQQC